MTRSIRLAAASAVLWSASAVCVMPSAWCEPAAVRAAAPPCHGEAPAAKKCCGGASCGLAQRLAFTAVQGLERVATAYHAFAALAARLLLPRPAEASGPILSLSPPPYRSPSIFFARSRAPPA